MAAAGAATLALALQGGAMAATPPAWTPARITAAIRAAWPDDPNTAVCIATHESRLSPTAYNAGQYGLFQIGAKWHPGFLTSRGFEVLYNIRWARHIYLDALNRWGWADRWRGTNGQLWTTFDEYCAAAA